MIAKVISYSTTDFWHTEPAIKFRGWMRKLPLWSMSLLSIDVNKLVYKMLLVWCTVVDKLFSWILNSILDNDFMA